MLLELPPTSVSPYLANIFKLPKVNHFYNISYSIIHRLDDLRNNIPTESDLCFKSITCFINSFEIVAEST